MIEEVHWDYSYTLDPVPQQSKEHNRLYPFFDNLKAGQLTTTRCPACEKEFWPPRTVCPVCFNDSLVWVDLPLEGSVMGFSIQTSGAPPGFSLPMIFARVKLTNQVCFIARVIEVEPSEMSVGMLVQLAVVPAPRERVLWAFKPSLNTTQIHK